jgi:hypothetical protein
VNYVQYTSLSVFGDFDFSTTTRGFPVGKYYMNITVRDGSFCALGGCLFHDDLYATTTTFVVDQMTLRDIQEEATQAERFNIANYATTTESITEACSVFGGGGIDVCIGAVLSAMFKPSNDVIGQAVTDLKAGAFSHKPLGYITLFSDIVSGDRKDVLPTLSYTFATTSPAVPAQLTGATISFNPWIYMASSTGVIKDIVSIGGNQTAKNVWDITMSTIDMFIYFGLIVMIIGQLLNINLVGSSTDNKQQYSSYSGKNKYTGNLETTFTNKYTSSTQSGGAVYRGIKIL